MIQEIINNALKHSGATRLQIDISVRIDKLMLEVSDNGKGFNTDYAMNNSSGLGIKNIFGRTRMLIGYMYLLSAPVNVTNYKIEIPLACNELQDRSNDRR